MRILRNLDTLALCETKMKGKGEYFFGNNLGYVSGARE